jgi:hypothetical protein
MSKIARFLILSGAWRILIAGELQLPLLVEDGAPAAALHVGEEVDAVGLDGVLDGVVAGPGSLLFWVNRVLH